MITGASSGLGEALAHVYYSCGCRLILISRRREELQRVKDTLMNIHYVSLKNKEKKGVNFLKLKFIPNNYDKKNDNYYYNSKINCFRRSQHIRQ